MIDDRTPHHNLPLPSPANRLSEDVERLRSSLGMIDAWMASIEGLLTSDDISLDSLQELVNALKSDQSGVAGLVAQMAAITAALAAKADSDLGNVTGAAIGALSNTGGDTALQSMMYC